MYKRLKVEVLSGADGDRTHDLVNAIHALSQLSYSPTDKRYYSCVQKGQSSSPSRILFAKCSTALPGKHDPRPLETLPIETTPYNHKLSHGFPSQGVSKSHRSLQRLEN